MTMQELGEQFRKQLGAKFEEGQKVITPIEGRVGRIIKILIRGPRDADGNIRNFDSIYPVYRVSIPLRGNKFHFDEHQLEAVTA